MRSRTASLSAAMILGSVGSWGSPVPKSITSSPCASRSSAAWLRRTNGYVDWARRTGEIDISRLACQEPPKDFVDADERVDLDLLVAGVRIARRPGPEID